MEKYPSKAQIDALLNILSAGQAHGVRKSTLAVLVREGWIIAADDTSITPMSWRPVQLSESIIQWFRMRQADQRLYGNQGTDERWRFRMEMLESTADRWNRNRWAASPLTGKQFDLWRSPMVTNSPSGRQAEMESAPA